MQLTARGAGTTLRFMEVTLRSRRRARRLLPLLFGCLCALLAACAGPVVTREQAVRPPEPPALPESSPPRPAPRRPAPERMAAPVATRPAPLRHRRAGHERQPQHRPAPAPTTVSAGVAPAASPATSAAPRPLAGARESALASGAPSGESPSGEEAGDPPVLGTSAPVLPRSFPRPVAPASPAPTSPGQGGASGPGIQGGASGPGIQGPESGSRLALLGLAAVPLLAGVWLVGRGRAAPAVAGPAFPAELPERVIRLEASLPAHNQLALACTFQGPGGRPVAVAAEVDLFLRSADGAAVAQLLLDVHPASFSADTLGAPRLEVLLPVEPLRQVEGPWVVLELVVATPEGPALEACTRFMHQGRLDPAS